MPMFGAPTNSSLRPRLRLFTLGKVPIRIVRLELARCNGFVADGDMGLRGWPCRGGRGWCGGPRGGRLVVTCLTWGSVLHVVSIQPAAELAQSAVRLRP